MNETIKGPQLAAKIWKCLYAALARQEGKTDEEIICTDITDEVKAGRIKVEKAA